MTIKTRRLEIHITDVDFMNTISSVNDAKSVDSLFSSLTEEQFATIFHDKKSLQKIYTLLDTLTASDDIQIWGAQNEKDLIGYLAINNYSSKTPEIQIEIVPSHQNMGYGTELMSAVLENIFTGHEDMCLFYTVLPSNEASIRLIEKIGGILQKSDSAAEEILLRTYCITKDSFNPSDSY